MSHRLDEVNDEIRRQRRVAHHDVGARGEEHLDGRAEDRLAIFELAAEDSR